MEVTEWMIADAIALMNTHYRCTTTLFIRRMRIPFRKACYLMEALEERGIVGPPMKGGGAREILKAGVGGVPRF